jgi:hypothetical protein
MPVQPLCNCTHEVVWLELTILWTFQHLIVSEAFQQKLPCATSNSKGKREVWFIFAFHYLPAGYPSLEQDGCELVEPHPVCMEWIIAPSLCSPSDAWLGTWLMHSSKNVPACTCELCVLIHQFGTCSLHLRGISIQLWQPETGLNVEVPLLVTTFCGSCTIYYNMQSVVQGSNLSTTSVVRPFVSRATNYSDQKAN